MMSRRYYGEHVVANRQQETMNLKENTERFFVRMPPDVKLWIMKQAQRNASSQNSEIVRCIRERMDRVGVREATAGRAA